MELILMVIVFIAILPFIIIANSPKYRGPKFAFIAFCLSAVISLLVTSAVADAYGKQCEYCYFSGILEGVIGAAISMCVCVFFSFRLSKFTDAETPE